MKAAIALGGDVKGSGSFSGNAGTALGAGLADILLIGVGDDVAVVDAHGSGVSIEVPASLDPTRRSGKVSLSGAAGELLTGARSTLTDMARLMLAAEATGVARECTLMAAEYAKVRPGCRWPGRDVPGGQASAAPTCWWPPSWPPARCAGRARPPRAGAEFSFAAASAAALAIPAADLCANLNTQVHGGIGFTWEHDAHLYLRQRHGDRRDECSIRSRLQAHLTDLTRQGVKHDKNIELPPEAEVFRTEALAFADSVKGLDKAEQRNRMIETGYVMPHWPKPWGRDAGAVEQIVIEQEGDPPRPVRRPQYTASPAG